MTKRPAPSAKKLLDQLSEKYPNRSRASDGIIPSAAHTKMNPRSDHEPGRAGYCHAVDVTHDPEDGVDIWKLAESLRRSKDKRIKYIICKGNIFTSYRVGKRKPFEWGKFTGSNPHSKHMHMSIIDQKWACESTKPWSINPRKFVKTPEKAAAKATKRENAYGWYKVYPRDGLNLRRKPDGQIIKAYPHGTKVKRIGPSATDDGEKWYPVRTKTGRKGWMAAKFLKKV